MPSTATQPTTKREAVALVIRTAGWNGLAAQYLRDDHLYRTGDREKIARIVAKDLRKRFGDAYADRFVRLEAMAREG